MSKLTPEEAEHRQQEAESLAEAARERETMTPLRKLHHVMVILFPFILAGLLIGLWELI